MLKDRQKTILGATVKEYIRTARPVASRELVHEFSPEFSTATIRNEMFKLDEYGYLEQPHTSAGRIPTDKGYRFFVDNLLEDFELSAREERMIQHIFDGELKEEEFVRELCKAAAHISSAFALGGLQDEATFYNTGFSELLGEPEFHNPASLRDFGEFIDNIDALGKLFRDPGFMDEERIFIGEENPLKLAHPYTIIFSSWIHPHGFNGFLAMIGPKRTNYPKHRAFIKSLKSKRYE